MSDAVASWSSAGIGHPAIAPALSLPDIGPLPGLAARYPELRYMGSKRRLLPWIFQHLNRLDFETAVDPFVGSGCVAYLLKCMGRRVSASDFLNFPATIASATVENDARTIEPKTAKTIAAPARRAPTFIERTFAGVFFTQEDLRFLDRASYNIERLPHRHEQALARAALMRACLKKQPRGVFTITGNRYDDGRRDLRLSIEEHFFEQIEAFNGVIFGNGYRHTAKCADVFALRPRAVDLVYLDPPYVPRADDNCYVKRYHFLEGLSCYWRDLPVMEGTKVKKIAKRYTPFSYRHTAHAAFDRLFRLFRQGIIVLSYSSNGYPDLPELEASLRHYKKKVEVYERPHRYHFGTHHNVSRAEVREYLLIGR